MYLQVWMLRKMKLLLFFGNFTSTVGLVGVGEIKYDFVFVPFFAEVLKRLYDYLQSNEPLELLL